LIFAGVGFGALTVEGARPFVEQGTLFQLPPYDQLPINNVYLVSPANTPLSEVEKLFVTLLKKNVKQSVRQSYFQ
jgi:hypothetical protein